MCHMLQNAISSFYIVAVSSALFLSTIHLCLLLDKQKKVLISLLSVWLLVPGGSMVFVVGVTGNAGSNSLCQDQIEGEWVGAAFVALFVYHAVVLAVVFLAVKQNVSADRENLLPQQRYERMARKKALYLVRPLTIADHVFFS